jgi:hypothetical protein
MADDSVTAVIALSYAVAALEKLPAAWRPADELADMRAMLGRVALGDDLVKKFLDVSRDVLDGKGQLRARPKLV